MTVGLGSSVGGARRGFGRRGRRGAGEVVVILPLLELVAEQPGVVDDLAFEEPVELL